MFILKRLLIVDDNIGVQRLLYVFFGEKGFDVSLASNGEEALKRFAPNGLIRYHINKP